MSAGEAVRCLGCKLFTVEPRAAPNLVELDKKMAAEGLGRCANTRENHVWHSAGYARQCPQFAGVDAAELEGRTRYMRRIRAQ